MDSTSAPNSSMDSALRATALQLFENLWQDYTSFNPQAKRLHDIFLKREREHGSQADRLVNDHIALRTFNVEPIGLPRISALFQRYGYREMGEYKFQEKKLYARHLEHPDLSFPRIFISELETEKFSPSVRKMVDEVAAHFTSARVQQDDLLYSGRSWDVSHTRYKELLSESEYAGWVYAFGFRVNHFTISFNALSSFQSLLELNSFVKENGFSLNASGGEIKGTPTDCLEQSSTMAETTEVDFQEGKFRIPSCYYEFARRYRLPNGEYYQGFVAASADKIFESTDTKQIRK